MKKLFMLLTIFSLPVAAWECPETNNSFDLHAHWNASEQIFVGTVLSAQYEPERELYTYHVRIDKNIQSEIKNEEIVVHGESNPPQLPVGVGFLFLLLKNQKMDFCTLVPHFESKWLSWDYEDLPQDEMARSIWRLFHENL